MEQQPTKRNHAIDALRVSAFGILIIYHLGMGYVNDWDWHIKSAYLTDTLQIPMLWSNQWRMSLLFLISGFALAAMLRTRPLRVVFRQRLTMLGVPLIAGIFLWVVPQVYIELAHQGALQNIGFSEFLIRYWHPLLDLPAGYGRLPPTTWTWNHLWFLPYVMSYCAVYLAGCFVCRALAIYIPVKALQLSLSAPFALALLLTVPTTGYWLIGEWLYHRFPTTFAFYNDWFNHASYFWSFVMGAALVHSPALLKQLARYWLASLALAVVTFAIVACFYTHTALTEVNEHLQGFIWSGNRWLWQLTAIAVAMRFLAGQTNWVAFFKPRIFCYYIVHQTLLVIAIYQLSPLRLGAIEAIVVLIITITGCELSYQAGRKLGRFSPMLGVSRNESAPV